MKFKEFENAQKALSNIVRLDNEYAKARPWNFDSGPKTSLKRIQRDAGAVALRKEYLLRRDKLIVKFKKFFEDDAIVSEPVSGDYQ